MSLLITLLFVVVYFLFNVITVRMSRFELQITVYLSLYRDHYFYVVFDVCSFPIHSRKYRSVLASCNVAWFSEHFNGRRLKTFVNHANFNEASSLMIFSTVLYFKKQPQKPLQILITTFCLAHLRFSIAVTTV